MRTRLCLSTAAFVLAVAAAPASAAAPFGQFGGIVGGGNSGSGLIPLHGWALDDDGIEAVDIVVAQCENAPGTGCQFDRGYVAGRASYGRARANVSNSFPDYPDSDAPGFAFQLDTTRYDNGLYRVWPRVRSESGEVANLAPKLVQFLNSATLLAPYGEIEFPDAAAEMRGNCNLADTARRYSVVSGYALDVGLTDDDEGIGYVELLIDRALWANTDMDCRFSSVEGGMSDCYGIRRDELGRFFPIVKDDPHVGFRFVLDVGSLIGSGFYLPGHHLITIRAGDNADQIENIDEFHVTFTCDEFLPNEEAKGRIVRPAPGNMAHGEVMVTGWAVDWEGIIQVKILVDGQFHSFASYGHAVPGLDLAYFFPGYPAVAAPGFGGLVDTTEFSNGVHEIAVVTVDFTGDETVIGEERVVFNNVGF